jgi:lysophospholipid acyltransferase (LPLAT)-like uncharacterized protein
MKHRAGFRRAVTEGLAGTLGPALIRLLGATLNIRKSGLENMEAARAHTGNFIYTFWHGRLLLPTYVHRNEGIQVLVSTHQDGEYIARVIHGLGFGTIRGSSTRGGTRALLGMLEAGSNRADIGITPDGPRGPREKCQAGIIYLAMKTGLPILPMGVSHKPSLILSSWDRFMIPLPFARCMVVYGEPVRYGGTLSQEAIEAAKLDLERRLKAVTREADDGCGRSLV